MSATAPLCSVVIPNYNGRRFLERCLAGIAEHRPRDISVEILVVDDGSSDDSAAFVAAHHPDVRVIVRKTNGGFCAAANDGIAAARGEFIQLLNNDTCVTAGWIEAGLAPFAAPQVGAVAPLVAMMQDPTRVDSAGDDYTFWGNPCKRGHGEPIDRWDRRGIEPVLGASASSAFYRAHLLRRVGGFDPWYIAYFDDVDLAFRLRWAGFHCVFQPQCKIFHEISASHDHGSVTLQRRIARNAEILFWTRLPHSWRLARIAPHIAMTAARIVHRAAQGRLRPFLLGKWDALVTLRQGRFRREDRSWKTGFAPIQPIPGLTTPALAATPAPNPHPHPHEHQPPGQHMHRLRTPSLRPEDAFSHANAAPEAGACVA